MTRKEIFVKPKIPVTWLQRGRDFRFVKSDGLLLNIKYKNRLK